MNVKTARLQQSYVMHSQHSRCHEENVVVGGVAVWGAALGSWYFNNGCIQAGQSGTYLEFQLIEKTILKILVAGRFLWLTLELLARFYGT